MKYVNPVIKGFYPDPSVCFANGKYYLVTSSFQYFPGVPLFESDDLVNWRQIGHVLTRKSQVMLEKINSSGGVFAPTIRYNNGRFYMVTTNDTTHRNFYVYTDDIYGEWSEPIEVDQGGIDPSLYFENGRTYFMSNGADERGIAGVVQCEINIETGEKLSPSTTIWQGSGGRYLESPHLYKIGKYYYLMAAEGGTEYGHMVTCARAESVWGPFTGNPANPVLTNRNKAPFIIQGIGHGDLICDKNGDWHILTLGFRQIHMWQTFHHLGREVFLTPVRFGGDGWFTAGNDGTTDFEYELCGDFVQEEKRVYTFGNTDFGVDWCFIRHPHEDNYELKENSVVLHGTDITLNEADSPTFVGIRQRDFCFDLSVNVTVDSGEGGVTVYMDEGQHYDIAIRKTESGHEAFVRLNIGGIEHENHAVAIDSEKAELMIQANNFGYKFCLRSNGAEHDLGFGLSKFLSSEVCGGFTGVILGLYAVGNNRVEFDGLHIEYKDE